MKKSHCLFFLSLISYGSFACADSFYAGFQAGADFFANAKKIRVDVVDNTPLIPDDTVPNPYYGLFSTQNKIGSVGGTGGLFLGYSWRFQDASLGIEMFGNGNGSNTKQTFEQYDNASTTYINFSAIERLKGNFGVVVKPGFLVNEKARLYLKAGWAKGRFTIEGTDAGILGITTTGRLAQWVGAWKAGIGSEIFFTPFLALSLEYNHIRYQKKNYASEVVDADREVVRTTAQYRPQSNNVLVGLTYYFTPQESEFAPLVTKDDGGYDA